MQIEVKKLELTKNGSWIKRNLSSPRFIKTIIYMIIGAVAGFALFYFGEGKTMVEFTLRDAMDKILMGAFFGFFLTNSPCARGRC